MTSQTRAYLIALLSLLSTVLSVIAATVPAPWSWTSAVLALLAGGAAGLTSKVPRFLVGKPLVSVSLAGPMAVLSAVMVDQAFAAPEGLARAGLLAVAVLLSGLAGKPLPVPPAKDAKPLLLALLAFSSSGLLSGCATSYRAAVTGPDAFSFALTPEQCAHLMKERRDYRATESVSLYVSGAGALVSALALALSDEKLAPAVSTSVSLAAGGVSAFTSSQVSDLDQELAAGGCGR